MVGFGKGGYIWIFKTMPFHLKKKAYYISQNRVGGSWQLEYWKFALPQFHQEQ